MEMKRKERIEGAVGRALLGLPTSVVQRLAGEPVLREGRRLDAQVQLLLKLASVTNKKHAHEQSVAVARRSMDVSASLVVGSTTKVAAVEDDQLAGCPVRIYRPKGDAEGRALLFFHGGGFVVGSLDSHDAPCRELAERVPCTVVSVDYRLAPEHVFPAAVDDATAAFRELVSRAAELGVDPQRIAVGGDSAGGNIAAVVALDTRHDAVRPWLQLLIYPVVDMTMASPSLDTFGSGFFLEKDTITYYRDSYLGDADRRGPRASPLFVDDLTGLPPALVITAGFDPLRDEGDAYAARLRQAGSLLAHHQHPQLFHGFWNTTTVIREAERAFDEAVGVVRARFAS